jgi:hypothetical protein
MVFPAQAVSTPVPSYWVCERFMTIGLDQVSASVEFVDMMFPFVPFM